MAEVHSLSTTDASNTARFPENQAPGTVNNGARALEGMIARADRDNDGSLTTGGTSTAYTVTLNSQHSAWFNGLRFRAKVDQASGATPTINPTGSAALGAKSLYWANGVQVNSDLAAGIYDFVYLSSPDKVYVLASSAGGVVGAAGRIYGSDGTTPAWVIPPYALENPIINGEFRIWQRGTSLSGQADDTYTADRWYILTQTGTIADARQSNPFDGARRSAQMTQSQASAQRIGRAQIIEGVNCIHLRGQAVTFYGRFKISNDQNMRVAILEWTGTEDSVTSDVVNDWTSGTYTAGNFFLGSNLAVSAVKQYASPGTGWVDFFVNATLGSSFNNLIVMIWTEGTAAQNVTFAQANCGLIRGSVPPTAHRPRPITEELALCQRYYTKTFALDTAPAQNVGAATGESFFQAPATGAVTVYQPFYFPVRMRGNPTVTFYNPQAANAQVRNAIDAADCSSTTLDHARDNAFLFTYVGNAGMGVGDLMSVHWTAAAEL